jgi:hypothetical protein
VLKVREGLTEEGKVGLVHTMVHIHLLILYRRHADKATSQNVAKKTKVSKSKGPQTLEAQSVDNELDEDFLELEDSKGAADAEASDINAEIKKPEPVKKARKTKGRAKNKDKVTMPKLREEIRTRRKEAPKSVARVRVRFTHI